MQDKYDQLVADFHKQLPNEKYMFEVTKCCGYSTIVMVNKRRSTLIDLYKEVSTWFECRSVRRLYLVSPGGGEHDIPVTDVVSIKDYISANPTLFTPVYPIPNWIVYRVYFDDGHSHSEECNIQK